MVVILEDIYRLPQLNGAAILSGNSYLWKKITSVRVLRVVECIDHEIGFDKNELAITTFDEVWEEPHLQQLFIEELVRSGVVGLILFSSVPGRSGMRPDAVQIAESLSLPVISLPGRNDPMLCGEIISAVDRLLRDAENESTLSVAMLGSMTRNTYGEQSIQAAIKLLSSWVNASVVMTDSSQNVIACSTYGNLDPAVVLRQIKVLPSNPNNAPVFMDGLYLYHRELQQSKGAGYHFYVLRSVRMERQELTTVANALRFAIRLWGEQENTTTSELVKAMLQDEPLRKSQLANMFHINVEDMDALWILHCLKTESQALDEKLRQIRALGILEQTLTLTDIYEQSIVLFMRKPETLAEITHLQQEILGAVDEDDVLFCVENLPNTAEARNIYKIYAESAADCRRIFPLHRVMSDAHLNLAHKCRKMMLTSPNYADIVISPIYHAKGKVNPQEMVDFLSSYLLDADMDVNLLSERLYLHRNTIKYRLNVLSNVFGIPVGSSPDTFYLMLVCAIRRLEQ